MVPGWAGDRRRDRRRPRRPGPGQGRPGGGARFVLRLRPSRRAERLRVLPGSSQRALARGPETAHMTAATCSPTPAGARARSGRPSAPGASRRSGASLQRAGRAARLDPPPARAPRAHLPYDLSIVIADNASTDETPEVARGSRSDLPGVEVMTLAEKGRGRALAAWSASDADVVCYMDVDLSTDLRALLPLLAPLVSGHSDVAIGSRLCSNTYLVEHVKYCSAPGRLFRDLGGDPRELRVEQTSARGTGAGASPDEARSSWYSSSWRPAARPARTARRPHSHRSRCRRRPP